MTRSGALADRLNLQKYSRALAQINCG